MGVCKREDTSSRAMSGRQVVSVPFTLLLLLLTLADAPSKSVGSFETGYSDVAFLQLGPKV
jgi:hypothetical protein